MDAFANHTFQPGATVRRSELAQTAAALLRLASASQPDQLKRWQSTRPTFSDMSASNLQYAPAAVAVSAGAMATTDGRFEPTRAATGAEALAVVARIEQLSRGGK
jgi:hypothetical protein